MGFTQEDYNRSRLHIFESCENGIIDEYKKDALLESLNDVVDAYNYDEITESEANNLLDAIDIKADGEELDDYSDYAYESYSSHDNDDVTYITESEYKSARLKIYNDYEAGIITRRDKDNLLNTLNSKYEPV